MNIHSNHLFHSIAICLVSIMALFTSCDKTDNVTGGIDSPDENTRYLLQPPTISIEPFGGGSPATRSAVAIEEERQAFNIGDELGNIITLGNSEVEDTPQTRTLDKGTYYRIVIYKKSDWDNNPLKVHAQRLCKTGETGYLSDLNDSTDPIYLYPGDYRIFCYSFNKTSSTKLSPLVDGTVNVPLSDGDDFLSADIISKSISSGQLGTDVSLGTITLKHRCCRLTGTLSAAAFGNYTGISSSLAPSLSVTSSFYTAGNWSIKNTSFSGATAKAAKTITLSKSDNTYTGSLIVPPPSDQSLSASYNFQPNGGKEIKVTNKPITTNTTFTSGGSYSFTIKAIGAYVLTETGPVQIGENYKWATANLNGQGGLESQPWVSAPLTGSGLPSETGSVTTANNDWWRWEVLDVDVSSATPTNPSNLWASEKDPCTKKIGSPWKVPTEAYFKDLIGYRLVSKKVYINGETITTTAYGWMQGNNTRGNVFCDLTRGTCIFLPAAGYRIGSNYRSVGTNGSYWSATLTTTLGAYFLRFGSNYCNVGSYTREEGYSLRCAQPK